MNISEFNAAYERQFHFYEMPEYANSRNKNIRLFKMAQWNPIAESYCGMLVPGIWHLNFKSEDDTPVPDDASLGLPGGFAGRPTVVPKR